jgi:multidrug efflux pump subunit AcrA (membrane-fusion protein)
MLVVTFGLIGRADEVISYTSYTYAEYGLAAILFALLSITILHEFAHGLACKHFGGEVREMGVLMIFYVLPAFYCNVTDIHRIGRKRERLWVIFAGIYWQLIVSAAGALVWLVATPYTLISDFAFLILLGGTFNILINCNPLIKLDGYYALTQLLGVENLQARSSEYARSLIGRATGTSSGDGRAPGERPLLYVTYWLCSIAYSVALIWFILAWMGRGLMDGLGLLGVALTLLLAVLLTERWWKPLLSGVYRAAASYLASKSARQANANTGVLNMSAAQPAIGRAEPEKALPTTTRTWPRRSVIVKTAIVIVAIGVLVAPWEASTGSDCALLLPPGHEGVARANTDAVLTEIFVQPGDAVSQGARLARLSNPEIEDRLTQLTAEITRLDTNTSRIEEELRVRSEMLLSANFTELERRRLANELKEEAVSIAGWQDGPQGRGDTGKTESPRPPASGPLPAALAVLNSEIDLKQAQLDHNRREAARYKKLVDKGLLGDQEYDRAVSAVRVTEKELQGAQSRLQAAMVEHRRVTSGAQTSTLVAETESRAARSNFEALIAELHANRQQLESLRQRRDILQREYDGMSVLAPRSGVVLGEDLQKMIGRRYGRGEEICRVGQLERFLLRIDVNEREIANVRLDSPVRFKLKTVAGRTFTGVVSKINAEPSVNQYGQKFYPVEVSVENSDGILRPGMTGFARISFGRQSIGLIVADKMWQALRPELWLF